MSASYVRRFRMEFLLSDASLPKPNLSEEFRWLAWTPKLLDRHAIVKYDSFRGELDANIFSCLGDLGGCHRLMYEISNQKAFLPNATWLIATATSDPYQAIDCGTIQGIEKTSGLGAIQNVGILPEFRGKGLGRALVLKALHGFQQSGMKRVSLEVTSENHKAIDLYHSIGFKTIRTMYKPLTTTMTPS